MNKYQSRLWMFPVILFLFSGVLTQIKIHPETAHQIIHAGILPNALQFERELFLERVKAAGNSEDEKERFRLLNEALSMPGVEQSLKNQLTSLLEVVDYWANDSYRNPDQANRAAENGYLCGFFIGKISLERHLIPGIPEDSPLFPIKALYRGRLLIQMPIQSGNLLSDPESRNAYYGEGRRLLKIAAAAFPENRIIKMYLDQPLEGWPFQYDSSPRAPEWANLQREGLEKLADIVEWWVDNRQIESGEFGGGWGDDCEMWRWWAPVMIAFQHPKMTTSQEKFSNGIFAQPHMKFGYTTRMSDVEHTAEDSKDAITAMMHLKPEENVWKQRALRIAELMRDKWTGINERGFLQFKGTYFNVNEVHPDVKRACDTVWHPGAVQPTLLYWQRTRDPELTRLFSQWMYVWVDITRREERGKPAGIIPSAIHWPEGFAGGIGEKWYVPEIDRQAHLYNWPGSMTMLTNTLLLVYFITGEDQFLEPIRSMSKIRLDYLKNPPATEPLAGSLNWCAAKMGFLSETLSKYRCFSGDSQFDRLLLTDANGYSRFRISGDRKALIDDLLKNALALRSNWPGYTGEVRWTDRVISFTRNYLNYFPSPPPQVDSRLLYASATGDMGDVGFFPLNAVRWLTLPREIAALVTDAGRDRFTAEVFHFGQNPRKMGAEFYLLQPGKYQFLVVEISMNREKEVTKKQLVITEKNRQVEFQIPHQQLCRIIIKPL